VRVSHKPGQVSAVFDDPNLVSCAGLAPVVALAYQCGLTELVLDRLTLPAKGGVNAHLKIGVLVAGMVAGADSIDDMDLLRDGGMDRLFGGVRAPSTLGTFLRTFTFGHVRQLDSVAATMLAELARRTPLLPGADQLAYVDVDDTVKATYGYAKQGAGYGYSGVKGLNALIATVSTPLAAPVICATRLRKGATNSGRGAERLVADALKAAKAAGAGGPDGSGPVVLRADSAFYSHDVIAAARRAKLRYSITARMNPAGSKAIASIEETAWTPISYPNAVWDDTEQRLISDAEIAEIPYTAFTSRRMSEHIDGRLIVRRVKRLNPANPPANTGKTKADKTTDTAGRQQELFALRCLSRAPSPESRHEALRRVAGNPCQTVPKGTQCEGHDRPAPFAHEGLSRSCLQGGRDGQRSGRHCWRGLRRGNRLTDRLQRYDRGGCRGTVRCLAATEPVRHEGLPRS